LAQAARHNRVPNCTKRSEGYISRWELLRRRLRTLTRMMNDENASSCSTMASEEAPSSPVEGQNLKKKVFISTSLVTKQEAANAELETTLDPRALKAKVSSQKEEAEAKIAERKRVSLKYATRVKDSIKAVPMNKDMTWAEYSKKCYESFGRTKTFGCSCGQSLIGVSGVCRICGKFKKQEEQITTVGIPNLCWTDDLYELCSPLLTATVKLNHSERQYVLRAVRQRLKAPPHDWRGADKPLKSAVDANCPDLVFLMLEAGMDPDEATPLGITALHDAVFEGRADICRILLDGGASVNILDRYGQSPLFFAPTVQICRLLCEAQADTYLVNKQGQTALHLAGRAGFREVLEWLTANCSDDVVTLHDKYGAMARHYLNITDSAVAKEERLSLQKAAARKVVMSQARRAQTARKWRSRVGFKWKKESQDDEDDTDETKDDDDDEGDDFDEEDET